MGCRSSKCCAPSAVLAPSHYPDNEASPPSFPSDAISTSPSSTRPADNHPQRKMLFSRLRKYETGKYRGTRHYVIRDDAHSMLNLAAVLDRIHSGHSMTFLWRKDEKSVLTYIRYQDHIPKLSKKNKNSNLVPFLRFNYYFMIGAVSAEVAGQTAGFLMSLPSHGNNDDSTSNTYEAIARQTSSFVSLQTRHSSVWRGSNCLDGLTSEHVDAMFRCHSHRQVRLHGFSLSQAVALATQPCPIDLVLDECQMENRDKFFRALAARTTSFGKLTIASSVSHFWGEHGFDQFLQLFEGNSQDDIDVTDDPSPFVLLESLTLRRHSIQQAPRFLLGCGGHRIQYLHLDNCQISASEWHEVKAAYRQNSISSSSSSSLHHCIREIGLQGTPSNNWFWRDLLSSECCLTRVSLQISSWTNDMTGHLVDALQQQHSLECLELQDPTLYFEGSHGWRLVDALARCHNSLRELRFHCRAHCNLDFFAVGFLVEVLTRNRLLHMAFESSQTETAVHFWRTALRPHLGLNQFFRGVERLSKSELHTTQRAALVGECVARQYFDPTRMAWLLSQNIEALHTALMEPTVVAVATEDNH